MNTNAKTIIDLSNLSVLGTVLLDESESGAANPWASAWSPDAETLFVAHAGTHEVSSIRFPAVVEKLKRPRTNSAPFIDPVNDLSFLSGLRERIKLPAGDLGPRGLAVVKGRVITANYFSDTLTILDPGKRGSRVSVRLAPERPMDEVRMGEFYFHDATICLQGWQSCASCHPGEGRVDALNWDLLNDGIGNPKNNKSLLLAHRTPPSMSLGVRENAEFAVRSGIKNILVTVQPPAVARAMDAYLKSLKPVPSPHLKAGGELSEAATRGQKIFNRAGCASCHPPGLFTDLQSYDVDTLNRFDPPESALDTPTLIEVWRTAPYLHDGSAATLREVFTTRNRADRHGVTSKLTEAELDDLCEYVLSL
jgi:mono/diheme cytochrome c family protein